MGQYDKLASIYDYLVQGVDYEAWADYLEELMATLGYNAKTIADLACGTGNTSLPLARKGYKVTGIDLAPAMINIAKEKAGQENLEIDFKVGDMREFTLEQPADLVTCYHDGLNYLVEPGDLALTFKQVYNALVPGGLFIFDFVNVHKLETVMEGSTTFVDEDDLSLVWDSTYDNSKDVWTITLTGFIRRGELYEKFQETHQEKAYTRQEIAQFLNEAGFELKGIYHSFSLLEPDERTRRIFYLARRG